MILERRIEMQHEIHIFWLSKPGDGDWHRDVAPDGIGGLILGGEAEGMGRGPRSKEINSINGAI